MAISEQVVIQSLKVLPQKAMSHAAGVLMGVPLPRPMATFAVKTFASLAGANVNEARDDIASFDSIQSFFVRALKDGARPIDTAADAFVSPCDGAWGASGTITDGTLFQVKGRDYQASALLGDTAVAAAFNGGTFATLYLSPKDYHRFHAPCDADVVEARHIPGALWPVNNAGIQFVDGLFTRNERIIALLSPAHRPDARIALVAVGATMVGKVRVNFDDLTTNNGSTEMTVRAYPEPKHLAKGEEWGRFEFGSTIVVLATPGALNISAGAVGEKLVLGTRIGTLT